MFVFNGNYYMSRWNGYNNPEPSCMIDRYILVYWVKTNCVPHLFQNLHDVDAQQRETFISHLDLYFNVTDNPSFEFYFLMITIQLFKISVTILHIMHHNNEFPFLDNFNHYGYMSLKIFRLKWSFISDYQLASKVKVSYFSCAQVAFLAFHFCMKWHSWFFISAWSGILGVSFLHKWHSWRFISAWSGILGFLFLDDRCSFVHKEFVKFISSVWALWQHSLFLHQVIIH